MFVYRAVVGHDRGMMTSGRGGRTAMAARSTKCDSSASTSQKPGCTIRRRVYHRDPHRSRSRRHRHHPRRNSPCSAAGPTHDRWLSARSSRARAPTTRTTSARERPTRTTRRTEDTNESRLQRRTPPCGAATLSCHRCLQRTPAKSERRVSDAPFSVR